MYNHHEAEIHLHAAESVSRGNANAIIATANRIQALKAQGAPTRLINRLSLHKMELDPAGLF